MKTIGLDEARAVKARAKKLFERQARVVGVGITNIGDGFGVKVNLETAPSPDAKLPDSIDGVPIRFEVVGTIQKQ